MVYHLRLLIDLKQREVVGVDIQRTDEHPWPFEIVHVSTHKVVNLFPPASSFKFVTPRCKASG